VWNTKKLHDKTFILIGEKIMEQNLCGCGKPSQHENWSMKNGKRYLCCECWVKEGNAPADWHYDCMKTYSELKGISLC
jgi:hypothetical protein